MVGDGRRFMRTGEAAEMFGLSPERLRELVRRGRVRHVRLTRTQLHFRECDLEEDLGRLTRGGRRDESELALETGRASALRMADWAGENL